MLNENKVKMMTKMAIYEKKQGRKMVRNSKYYKGDYIAYEVLRTLIAASFAYIFIMLLFVVCNIEKIVANINDINYGVTATVMVLGFILFLAFYVLISVLFYSKQYNDSRKGLKKYFSRLNKLERFYNLQSKGK